MSPWDAKVLVIMVRAQAPGYSRVISRPMDFATMWGRFRGGAYHASWDALADDLATTFRNAMLFNAPDTVYHKQARAWPLTVVSLTFSAGLVLHAFHRCAGSVHYTPPCESSSHTRGSVKLKRHACVRV